MKQWAVGLGPNHGGLDYQAKFGLLFIMQCKLLPDTRGLNDKTKNYAALSIRCP